MNSPTNDERVKEETHGSILRSNHKKIILFAEDRNWMQSRGKVLLKISI